MARPDFLDLVPRPEGATVIRCFGGLAASVAGSPVDLAALRPRARALLGLLAVNAGHTVHREVIAAALWPETPSDDVWRRIHVAVSCVRRVLGRETRAVARQGDGYLLEADVDVRRFDDVAAAAARSRGTPRERDLLAGLVAAYGGELLPEAGPAEWVVHERYHRRTIASDAWERLAALALAAGDGAEAVRSARQGLRVDPYGDGLWQAMFAGLRICGHDASAARAREDYALLLAEVEHR